MMLRFLGRLVLFVLGAGLLVAVLLALPILYVEAFCRGELVAEERTPLIDDATWRRSEAATYLTYPEWHIVYAYEEMAEILAAGDEHDFGYLDSIGGFWTSYCALNRTADRHGGGDAETRTMIYVIGASFTLEMALKGAYEETLGRLFAALRGPARTAQDEVAADMAEQYATFLRQTPWYRFPFADWANVLWRQPVQGARSWERRLALGAEWHGKQAYAGLIGQAVAAGEPAALRIRTVVAGLAPKQLEALDEVEVVGQVEGGTLIETPRYRRYTEILVELVRAGGRPVEIAGNDDLLVSIVHHGPNPPQAAASGQVLATMKRQGFGDHRSLVSLKVGDLAALIGGLAASDAARLEHIYDY